MYEPALIVVVLPVNPSSERMLLAVFAPPVHVSVLVPVPEYEMRTSPVLVSSTVYRAPSAAWSFASSS